MIFIAHQVLQKSYVVNDVLEDFKSKVGQHIEILDLEQFGKSLFIDGEIQVASTDEHFIVQLLLDQD